MKKKRDYFGAGLAAPLIHLLNAGKQLPRELTETLARVRASRDVRVKSALIGKVNMLLMDYKFFPRIESVRGNDVRVGWVPSEPVASANIVSLWLGLAEERLLSKLKQCAVCSKWFFAKFSHNEYDTVKCREKAAKQDAKRREARRKYERDYYYKHLKGGRK